MNNNLSQVRDRIAQLRWSDDRLQCNSAGNSLQARACQDLLAERRRDRAAQIEAQIAKKDRLAALTAKLGGGPRAEAQAQILTGGSDSAAVWAVALGYVEYTADFPHVVDAIISTGVDDRHKARWAAQAAA